jgi:hypothetical protein
MTRAFTTAEDAAVSAERNRQAWNLPRQPSSASPVLLDPSTSGRNVTSAEGVLDWRAFRSLHFPERRRHDLEALTAYGTYRLARRGETP